MGSRLEAMDERLGEKIQGRCSGLEECVDEVEQKSEARFISLEMACAEAEHVELDKQFVGLKMEVGRLNCFMERENLAHAQGKPGILSTNESAGACSSPSLFTDGPDGHRVETNHQDRESGFTSAHTHIPVNGTPHP
jgi:hypothetical protein